MSEDKESNMSNIEALKKIFEPDKEHLAAMEKLQEKRNNILEQLRRSLQNNTGDVFHTLLQQRKLNHDILTETDDMIQKQGAQNTKLFWLTHTQN